MVSLLNESIYLTKKDSNSFYLFFRLLMLTLLPHIHFLWLTIPTSSLLNTSFFSCPYSTHSISFSVYVLLYPWESKLLTNTYSAKTRANWKKIFWCKLLDLFITVFATHCAYTDDWISLKYKYPLTEKPFCIQKIVFRLSHLKYCSISSHEQTGSKLNDEL